MGNLSQTLQKFALLSAPELSALQKYIRNNVTIKDNTCTNAFKFYHEIQGTLKSLTLLYANNKISLERYADLTSELFALRSPVVNAFNTYADQKILVSEIEEQIKFDFAKMQILIDKIYENIEAENKTEEEIRKLIIPTVTSRQHIMHESVKELGRLLGEWEKRFLESLHLLDDSLESHAFLLNHVVSQIYPNMKNITKIKKTYAVLAHAYNIFTLGHDESEMSIIIAKAETQHTFGIKTAEDLVEASTSAFNSDYFKLNLIFRALLFLPKPSKKQYKHLFLQLSDQVNFIHTENSEKTLSNLISKFNATQLWGCISNSIFLVAVIVSLAVAIWAFSAASPITETNYAVDDLNEEILTFCQSQNGTWPVQYSADRACDFYYANVEQHMQACCDMVTFCLATLANYTILLNETCSQYDIYGTGGGYIAAILICIMLACAAFATLIVHSFNTIISLLETNAKIKDYFKVNLGVIIEATSTLFPQHKTFLEDLRECLSNNDLTARLKLLSKVDFYIERNAQKYQLSQAKMNIPIGQPDKRADLSTSTDTTPLLAPPPRNAGCVIS